MEYEKLKELIDIKLSTRKIAERLNCSQSNVKHWLKKYTLKTFVPARLTREEKLKKGVIAVSNRRRKLKLLSIEYKGGRCIKCGYNKHPAALDFHHENPDEKDFNIGKNGHTVSWEKLKKELNKCILLCANCHREEHAKSTGS